jgi:hypothetical protein
LGRRRPPGTLLLARKVQRRKAATHR